MIPSSSSEQLPQKQRTTVADALLGLYDCYHDPTKVVHLIDALGAWLAEEGSDINLGDFEQHSNKVWQLLSGHLGLTDVFAQKTRAQQTKGRSYLNANLDFLGEQGSVANLKDRLRVEDIGRIKNWLATQSSDPILVRAYPEIDLDGDIDPDDISSPSFLVLHRRDIGEEAPSATAVLYFEQADLSLGETVEGIFRSSFGTTQAELAVLRRLVLGYNGPKIAAELGKSNETIRSHIKGLTAKMGVSSQNEILATVRSVERQVSSSHPPSLAKFEGNNLNLPGGGCIGFETYGPDRGRPVLYVHGLLAGRHLPASIEPILKAHDVRLIVPARPGYGPTTIEQPDARGVLAQTVNSFALLSNAFGIDRTALIADGAGLIFALEFARTYPGRCGPIMALDPIPPVLSDEDTLQFRGRFQKAMMANLKSRATMETLFQLAFVDAQALKGKDDLLNNHYFRTEETTTAPTNESDLNARWANLQENLSGQFQHLIFDADLVKTTFLDFPHGSNMRPPIRVFQTQDSAYVEDAAVQRLAEKLDAPLIDAGPTMPYIEGQLPCILRVLGQI